ncbi:MAG: TonB family protein [bacterium]|nr:TonB family protein [bacterium]
MKSGFLRSGILLSVLAHLLLLRALVAGAGSVEPPARNCRELPIAVSLESSEAVVEPPGMPEALSPSSRAQSGPVEADIASRPLSSEPITIGKSLGEPVGKPVAEADLDPSPGPPAAVEVVEPTGISTPDAPPLKLNDRRWEGEVRVGVYVAPDGHPGKVWIIESSGRREADLDALAFFAKTMWSPATIDGEPVGWVLERTVAYRQPEYFP